MTGSQLPTAGQQRAPRETPSGELEAVRIWMLGGFRISVGSSRSIGEDEWRLKKAASLLKLLALAPGHRLHREQVMDLLWPELDSEAAANNLHHALHVARLTLEPSAALLPATSIFGTSGSPCAPKGRCGWMSKPSRKRRPRPATLERQRPTGRP
jgi:two-component SAPR family response regulator